MRISLHIYFSIFLFSIILNSFSLSQKKNSPQIAFTINGEPIYKHKVYDLFIKRYPLQSQEVIREIILQYIIKSEYKKEKIKIPIELIKKRAKKEYFLLKRTLKKQKISYKEYLKSHNTTDRKFKKELMRRWKYNFALYSLIRLYELRQKRIKARQILVKSYSKAQKILDKLKNGANFSILAQKESLSKYTASKGGFFPLIYKGDLPKVLEKVIFKLKPLEISNIIKSKWGYHIIQVVKIYKGNPNLKWKEVQEKIINSIQNNPITPKELERWLNFIKKYYKIKFY